MAEQMIFKRYEIKYMLNRKQFEELKMIMKEYMVADVHGKSTNCSLYFDIACDMRIFGMGICIQK